MPANQVRQGDSTYDFDGTAEAVAAASFPLMQERRWMMSLTVYDAILYDLKMLMVRKPAGSRSNYSLNDAVVVRKVAQGIH